MSAHIEGIRLSFSGACDMRTSSKAMAAGIIALSLAAGAAQAQEVMTTAGAAGPPISEAAAEAIQAESPPQNVAPLDTASQIQRWLAESPPDLGDDGQLLDLRRDRQMHGEVGVAVGTGGYRSAYITSVMPLGEKGTLALSFAQERNARGYYRGAYGYPYGEPLGYGLQGYGVPGYGPVW
jgi:hypothetical protein